ncbi:MAG: oligosaccharide flippase family protein [Bacteroidales bacterium]|nr:oligosaccharide flippase family protein [Bacteroidales bacterium]
MSQLQKQTISGVKWTTLHTIVSAITGPVLLWIKSVFLEPNQFAFISIILIVIGLVKLLETFGISQAIIQKDSITKKESSTLFFFNIFFSIFMGIILFFSAPRIAIFYEMPELESFLRYVIIIAILAGPALLFRAFLEKKLLFRRLSIIDMTGNIILFISTTVFLILDFGVLAIVFGHISSGLFTTTAIVFSVLKYNAARITVYFKPALLRPFLSFGVFVSAKQLLTYIANRADELLIGYFLTPEVLGVYHFGKNMLEKIRTLMTKSFGKVLYPVFSKLKHNITRLGQAYQQISRYISFGAFPVFSGIALTAHLFVPLFFGEKWLDSVIVFQVFSVSMIFMLLTANISSSLLYSLNKPKIVFFIDVVLNAVYFIALFIVAKEGMILVLITYSLYVILKTIVLQFYTNKYLNLSILQYIAQFKVPLIATLVMLIFVLGFQFLLSDHLNTILMFTVSAIMGIIVFTLMVYYTDKQTIADLKRAIIKGEIKAVDKDES